MKNHYNYEKIFFHRPLWTAENRRLWFILGAVALLGNLLVYNLLGWAVNYPKTVLYQQVKREYFALLAKETMKTPLSLATTNSDLSSGVSPRVAIGEKIEKNDLLNKAVEKMQRSRSAFEETMAEKPKGGLRFKAIARDELSAAGGVTEALEAVPGLAGIPLLTDRKERYLHLNNEREILKQFEKPFDIPRPELFLQPTFNGSRDVEETTAIISLNEVNIQYCFERYARYDPTLTGDVKVQFTIHPDGHVIPASIKIIESTIRDPRILRCIKKNLERWRNFPAVALENGNFTMTRKYVF